MLTNISGLFCIAALLIFCGRLSASPNKSARAIIFPVAEEKNTEVQAVFNRWIKALGGSSRIQSLQRVEIDRRLDRPDVFSALVLHSIELADGRFHYDLSSSERISGGFDGNRAWHWSSQFGFGYVPLDEFRTWLWRSAALVAVNLGRHYPKASFLGEFKVDGKLCVKIGMTAEDTSRENWYFEKKSNFLTRIEQSGLLGQATVVTLFSDFRKISGITLPFRTQQLSNGQTTSVRCLNIIINGPASADDFNAPSAHQKNAELVDRVLARYFEASGGRYALQRIDNRVTRFSMQAALTGTTTQVTMTEKKPDLFLREEETPGMGKTWTGFDGTVGWVYSDIQGFRNLKGPELLRWKGSADFEAEIDFASRFPLRTYLSKGEIRGRRVNVVTMATSTFLGGTFYFDEERGFLLRVETEVISNPNARVHVITDYDDFRTVEGLSMPFKITFTTPTVKNLISYDSITFNVPLSDSFFKERRDD